MKDYTVELVPTFLLYDALSWCIKNKRLQANFFNRKSDGVREDVIATPSMILDELERRRTEVLDGSILCVNCGDPTDGRCYFDESEQLCPVCYWIFLKALASGKIAPVPKSTRVIDISEPRRLSAKKEQMRLGETREEIALRMGLPLDMLESNGFFD